MTGAAAPGRPPKVLFILGKGRSGSTLLDLTLGAAEGFFSLGEVWWAWGDQNQLDQKQCGCGQRVGECPVWQPALELARETWASEYGPPPSLSEVAGWHRQVARWPRLPRAFLLPPRNLDRWRAMQAWARFSGVLYRALAQVTGARVLVDSSKWMGNPGPLGLVPGIDRRVLHLVRDPRAVAFSWKRQKEWLPGEKAMPRFGPIHSSLSWTARNVLAGYVTGRRAGVGIRVRYEDFTARPAETLERIFQFLGETPAHGPLRGKRTLALPENHTAMGNASRFKIGEVELRSDAEWLEAQNPGSRWLVTALTYPLLRRYGYPISARDSGREG
ncbi:MAG: sulfotransferase [Longimicrobiales bacterium]